MTEIKLSIDNTHEWIDYDPSRLSLKELIVLNKKMPKTNKEYFGGISELSMTLKLGIRMTIAEKNQWHEGVSLALMVESKKIIWGADATTDFVEDPNAVDLCIGDGYLARKFDNHIDSVFSPALWQCQMTDEHTPLESRKGWCCTMHKKRPIRDYICELIEKQYLNNFNGNEWFCYDAGLQFTNLFKFMFRQPRKELHGSKSKIFRLTDQMYRTKESFPEGFFGPWHQQNIIELIPEAEMDYFYFTEKTAKPINAGMPFVVVGCNNFLKRLRKIGFKTFHPYIDESYDIEPDWQKRTDMAVKAMFDFLRSEKNLPALQKICDHNYLIMKKIRQHNPIDRIAKKLRPYIFGT